MQTSPMRIEDYDEVVALWQATAGVQLNESDTREKIANYLERNRGLSRVVREQGRLVAAVLCGHEGRRGYLNHLAVSADYRRRGLGRLLVEECLAELAAQGIAKCSIFVFRDNDDGTQFWEQLGWRERAELKILQCATNGPAV